MDDFFEKSEPEAPEAPEVIKLGEQEYKPEELQEMVGFANKVKEFEEKSGTDFDSLTSSWGKRGERIGALEKELEEAKSQLQPKIKPEEGEINPQQVQEQARKMGIVTQADLDKYFEEKLSLREQATGLVKTCNKLEKKIDGKDGRPVFKTDEILEYMKETGIKTADKAYKLKFEKELDTWKEDQLKKRKPAGFTTETTSSAGGKKPSEVRITRDNLDEMVREALNERSQAE